MWKKVGDGFCTRYLTTITWFTGTRWKVRSNRNSRGLTSSTHICFYNSNELKTKKHPRVDWKVQIPFKRQIKGDQQEMRRERDWKRHNMWKKEGEDIKTTSEKNQNPRQRSAAVLLVELCGFFGQALQHAKMLTLHTVLQNNPNHYHLSTLKPCTLNTYKTNHTYPTLSREAQRGWGIRVGRKTG